MRYHIGVFKPLESVLSSGFAYFGFILSSVIAISAPRPSSSPHPYPDSKLSPWRAAALSR